MRASNPSGAFHETFTRAAHPGPSSRSFGLTFAVLFLVLGLLPLLFGDDVRLWALGLAAGLAVVGLVAPALLDIPNRLWLRLGRAINRVVGPAVLGLFFYGLFTPLAAVLRMFGRDPLKRRRPQDVDSYFVDRSTRSAGPSLHEQG
jgi:Saxitoxin biosynthesis operon protein SxtJ